MRSAIQSPWRLQVDDVGIEVVGPEGAVLAAFLPVRVEHEVVDDELIPSGEEIAERAASVRTLEDVVLLDALPRLARRALRTEEIDPTRIRRVLNTAYNYLDLVPKGRDEEGRPPRFWVRRHDEYDE